MYRDACKRSSQYNVSLRFCHISADAGTGSPDLINNKIGPSVLTQILYQLNDANRKALAFRKNNILPRHDTPPFLFAPLYELCGAATISHF